jgi:hypothetical protein
MVHSEDLIKFFGGVEEADGGDAPSLRGEGERRVAVAISDVLL